MFMIKEENVPKIAINISFLELSVGFPRDSKKKKKKSSNPPQ